MYDQETGLYYLQSRYYNPSWGRFINADRLINNTDIIGTNLFSYCANNPVINSDPNGQLLISAFVGGVIGGIAGAFSAAYNGDSVLAGFVTGAASGALMGVAAELLVGSALAYVACATVCSSIAGVGNIANQCWNYKIDKRPALQNKANTGGFLEEYPTFTDTVNRQSVFAAMGSAAAFAPLSAAAGVALGDIVNGATSGLEQVTVEIIVSLTTSGNLSMPQSITETILSIL